MTDTPERVWRAKPWIPSQHQHGLAAWPDKNAAGEGATEYVRADLTTRATDSAELLEALEKIQKPKYGLQGIIEDGDSAEERAEYYAGLVRRYEQIARAAIAKARAAQ